MTNCLIEADDPSRVEYLCLSFDAWMGRSPQTPLSSSV